MMRGSDKGEETAWLTLSTSDKGITKYYFNKVNFLTRDPKYLGEQ
jgi:hypothetical protein